MILHANCKINIGLDVLERRTDGFHNLNTAMIPIPMLYDIVEVNENQCSNQNPNEIIFRSLGTPIDCAAEDNLCVKAARLMQQRYNTSGVEIILDKRVPFGAGLGGGSSDATSVILAMNNLFHLNLSNEELIDVAAQIGSDTAFFVLNTPQLCSSRGEVMQPINIDLKGLKIALIKPEGVNVSTREAYAGVKPCYPSTPLIDRLQQPIELWQGSVKNDFEPHIFMNHPLLRQIKDDLLNEGAIYSAMSGSGSTIFALFHAETLRHPNPSIERYNPYIFNL